MGGPKEVTLPQCPGPRKKERLRKKYANAMDRGRKGERNTKGEE